VNAALARALLTWKRWPGLIVPLGTAGLLLAGALGYGWLWPPPEVGNSPMRIALVQGNIDQRVKWDPAWQERTLAIYQDLTAAAAHERPQLIVWPEAAVPFFFRADSRRAAVEGMARAADAYLLVGAPDWQAGQPRNTAFLIGPDGQMVGRYDKRHLVPFGEYVPLRQLLSFVNPLAGGAIGEFASGHEATVFATPNGRFSVVICYEAIFPDEVRDFFRGGADFLINITNDAWFGRSAAPAQHLAMAAFRAVENRAYLIRAANTGISAIVTPDGHIVQASGLFTRVVLSGAINPHTSGSFYTWHGDLFAWGTVGVAIVTAIGSLTPIVLPSWGTPRDGIPPTGGGSSSRSL
jgi:apolipoprotein N-acyltransferase